MRLPKGAFFWPVALAIAICSPLHGQEKMPMRTTAGRPMHSQSERQATVVTKPVESPPVPDGMTLDQVLDRAGTPAPPNFPKPVPDNKLRAFLLARQLEYRLSPDMQDQFGWRALGWLGYDFDKLWFRTEGRTAVEGPSGGESENDLLYSRLITPFWYAQAGVQYANEWERGDYDDRWAGALAVSGLAPGMFEVEASLYISEEADVTLRLEAEYDIRLTQRLVLQPRTELRFAAQDIPERNIGAGMTNADLEMRLRYEIQREFAPYLGIGYHWLVGETAGLARAAGKDPGQLFYFIGVRAAL